MVEHARDNFPVSHIVLESFVQYRVHEATIGSLKGVFISSVSILQKCGILN